MTDQNQTLQQLLKAVGLRIRDLRLQQGWSQQTMAANAGMDDSHLGDIERGERDLSTSTLKRIATALGIDVSALLEGVA